MVNIYDYRAFTQMQTALIIFTLLKTYLRLILQDQAVVHYQEENYQKESVNFDQLQN